jgi:hypothetical protein
LPLVDLGAFVDFFFRFFFLVVDLPLSVCAKLMTAAPVNIVIASNRIPILFMWELLVSHYIKHLTRKLARE